MILVTVQCSRGTTANHFLQYLLNSAVFQTLGSHAQLDLHTTSFKTVSGEIPIGVAKWTVSFSKHSILMSCLWTLEWTDRRTDQWCQCRVSTTIQFTVNLDVYMGVDSFRTRRWPHTLRLHVHCIRQMSLKRTHNSFVKYWHLRAGRSPHWLLWHPETVFTT